MEETTETTQTEAPDSNSQLNDIEAVIADFFPGSSEASTEEVKEEAEAGTNDEAGLSEVAADAQEAPTTDQSQELVSERLARLAELEAAERNRKTEADSKTKAEIEAAREEVKKAILAELMTDPQGFVDKYEIKNPGDLAMHFYRKELGDEAPEELVQRTSKNDYDRLRAEMQQLKQELLEQQQRQVVQMEAQKTLATYENFLSNVPDDLKYFKREASDSPKEAIEAMAQVADQYIATYGKYPDAAEVASYINTQLEKTVSKFIEKSETEASPPPVKAAEPETETLSDNLTERGSSAQREYEESEEDRIQGVASMLEEMFPPRKRR